ncbi:MAG TPA: hypothetical protein VFE58_01630 [Tepidisphaeraceae bacterium]|nr:hypothetical protein [Tepidisphaeraceae bacterium]
MKQCQQIGVDQFRMGIHSKISPTVVVHPEGWHGYGGLVDVGYAKQLQIAHGKNQFAQDLSGLCA